MITINSKEKWIMCVFFSCIQTNTGVLWLPEADDHEDIIEYYGLDDTTLPPKFVRVEARPPEGDVFCKDLMSWNIQIDQDVVPDGFVLDTEAVYAALKECLKLRVYEDVESVTLDKDYTYYIKNCRNVVVCNSSRAYVFNSNRVIAYDSSRVTAYDSSRVDTHDSSQVTAYDSSQVIAYDSSQVTAYNYVVCYIKDDKVKYTVSRMAMAIRGYEIHVANPNYNIIYEDSKEED